MSTVAADAASEQTRYPIGRFDFKKNYEDEIGDSIAAIEAMPSEFRVMVEDLADEQLDTPYRSGGWTVRQVVHHVADSHIHVYTRFRMGLAEENPTIMPYDENKWAEFSDAKRGPVELSLLLLGALHARWVLLMKSMSGDDWQRSFRHPELGDVRLDKAAAMYAWHGRHHLAHIGALRKQKGWSA